jgi:hypothetical protein
MAEESQNSPGHIMDYEGELWANLMPYTGAYHVWKRGPVPGSDPTKMEKNVIRICQRCGACSWRVEEPDLNLLIAAYRPPEMPSYAKSRMLSCDDAIVEIIMES